MNQEQFQRITRVAADYYRQADANPEPGHFEGWLDSMSQPMRDYFSKQGFEACQGVLDFRKFVAGLQGRGLRAHMRQHLSGSDYQAWLQDGK